ncbi:MAG: hypothetical protein U5N55_03355 [Cypionkella sp.]|nr:hypothetical protein [Cypionkella sp.]
MLKFFESLIDPYQPSTAQNTPLARLWPFLAKRGLYDASWARHSGGFLGADV